MATAVEWDLETFVAQHYARVVAAVRLMTGDHDAAADAVQEALVAMLANPPATPPDNEVAYVTAVASNKARDALRRGGALSRAYRKVGTPPEGTHDPYEALDTDVVAAIKALPVRQREVCVMHYLLDIAVGDIAKGLSVSDGTVKTQLHRARRALASTLQQTGGDRG